jgi:hypothetical protein
MKNEVLKNEVLKNEVLKNEEVKNEQNQNIKSFLSAALGALIVNILYNYFKF